MTTSGVVSTVASLPIITGGSYSLGFNFTINTPDYALFVLPGLKSGAILQVLAAMMSQYSVTFQGMIDGGNIEQPQPAVGIPAGGRHILGPVLIDNNLEGALSVDDWNVLSQAATATNIYGLVTTMLASTKWLAAGSLNPGIPNVMYQGNDRREVKLGRASKYFSKYVSGSTLPGSPGTLKICTTGQSGSIQGQVFFNPAYNIKTYPDTTTNPYVVTELPMVVSQNGTINPSSPITASGGDLEPYAQKLLQDWMTGVNINSQFQAITNSWTGYAASYGNSRTAILSGFGTTTRDLLHYCNLARATGLWATANSGQAVLTDIFNFLDALVANSASGLPQSYTFGASTSPPFGIPATGSATGKLPEANMQYLLARNPFANNLTVASTGGWFHP